MPELFQVLIYYVVAPRILCTTEDLYYGIRFLLRMSCLLFAETGSQYEARRTTNLRSFCLSHHDWLKRNSKDLGQKVNFHPSSFSLPGPLWEVPGSALWPITGPLWEVSPGSALRPVLGSWREWLCDREDQRSHQGLSSSDLLPRGPVNV